MIYFLHAASVNLVKIGFSFNPEDRANTLRLLSPVSLEIIGILYGDRDEEIRLHKRFSHLRAHGEWFHATEELKCFAALETMLRLWHEASAEARQEFLDRIDTPVFDRSAA